MIRGECGYVDAARGIPQKWAKHYCRLAALKEINL